VSEDPTTKIGSYQGDPMTETKDLELTLVSGDVYERKKLSKSLNSFTRIPGAIAPNQMLVTMTMRFQLRLWLPLLLEWPQQ